MSTHGGFLWHETSKFSVRQRLQMGASIAGHLKRTRASDVSRTMLWHFCEASILFGFHPVFFCYRCGVVLNGDKFDLLHLVAGL
jgi:hypothetical protein